MCIEFRLKSLFFGQGLFYENAKVPIFGKVMFDKNVKVPIFWKIPYFFLKSSKYAYLKSFSKKNQINENGKNDFLKKLHLKPGEKRLVT